MYPNNPTPHVILFTHTLAMCKNEHIVDSWCKQKLRKSLTQPPSSPDRLDTVSARRAAPRFAAYRRLFYPKAYWNARGRPSSDRPSSLKARLQTIRRSRALLLQLLAPPLLQEPQRAHSARRAQKVWRRGRPLGTMEPNPSS